MTRGARPGLALLLFSALLASCGLPESRLRSGLIEAGISPPMAECMAERMVDRLSLAQLRRLADLKRAGRAASLDEFLHRVRSLRDREILAVTSSSAAICTARRRR